MTAPNRPDNDPLAEPTLFSAIITPHRSLSGNGFLAVMALVGGLSFIGGMFFFLARRLAGDRFPRSRRALVYWAFRANYRAAAAFEEVTVTPSELRLRRVSHRGEIAEWTLNPLWTKLDREKHEEFGLLQAVSGVARAQAFGRGLPVAEGEGKLRRCAVRGPGRGPARTDAGLGLILRSGPKDCVSKDGPRGTWFETRRFATLLTMRSGQVRNRVESLRLQA